MALDRRRLADDRHALNDIGIERALREEIELTKLVRAFFEDVDERRADDLALALWIGHAREPREKEIGRVDKIKRQMETSEARTHLLGFIQPEQSVVNKDARQ